MERIVKSFTSPNPTGDSSVPKVIEFQAVRDAVAELQPDAMPGAGGIGLQIESPAGVIRPSGGGLEGSNWRNAHGRPWMRALLRQLPAFR
jgi:hypothetical protein